MTETQADSFDEHKRRFVEFMARHLVALTGVGQRFDDKGRPTKRGLVAISGFTMILNDRMYWVTAGHCLEESLDDQIKAGTLKVSDCGFADYFGPNALNRMKYPYHYEVGCAFYIDDSELGLDFAIIPLGVLETKNLLVNGVVPINRANWANAPNHEYEHFKVMGFPDFEGARDFSESSGGEISAGIRPVMVAVERLEPDEVDDSLRNKWFVGRIVAEATIPTVVGMSGGPIFGFRRDCDGIWSYHVVALQSWWRPNTRVIFGCELTSFAHALEAEIHASIDALETTAPDSLPE